MLSYMLDLGIRFFPSTNNATTDSNPNPRPVKVGHLARRIHGWTWQAVRIIFCLHLPCRLKAYVLVSFQSEWEQERSI